jgi:putative peptidoglycan lipid II flippase
MIEYPVSKVKRPRRAAGGSLIMGQDDPRSRLLRSTASVAAPTLVSRVLGYVRDLLQAYFLGTGHAADAFTIAFAIPNLFRRLTGEGALTPAFIPTFTEIRHAKGDAEAWRFGNLVLWDLVLIMAAVTGLGIAAAPGLVKVIAYGFRDVQGKWDLTILMTRIMFPYLFFVALAALAAGLLNSFRRFFVPASTPILFNVAVITAAAVWGRTDGEPAVVFAVGVAAGGVLQLALQIPFLRREGMRFRPALSFRHPGVRTVARLMVPGIFGAGVYQVNFALSRMIASGLETGSAAALYYASRIEELTLGLFSIALAAVLLPAFSEQAAARDVGEMKRTLGFALKLTSAVAIPAAAGLAALNEPIIRILFERGKFDEASTAMSAACLLFFAVGLPFVSGVKVLAPVFFSLKDTRTPVKAGVIVMAVNVAGALLLMGRLRVGGLALALSLSQILNFILLFVWLNRRIGPLDKAPLLAAAARSLAAAAVMGTALRLAWPALGIEGASFALQAAALAGAILAGILLYAGLIRLLGPRDFENLTGLLRRTAFGLHERGGGGIPEGRETKEGKEAR